MCSDSPILEKQPREGWPQPGGYLRRFYGDLAGHWREQDPAKDVCIGVNSTAKASLSFYEGFKFLHPKPGFRGYSPSWASCGRSKEMK